MRQTLRLIVPWFFAALLFAPLLEAQDEHFFDSDGVSIRYLEQGEGEPVVLIHGFSTSAEANWVLPGLFSALAREYRVIALDNRGHGKSGKPHDVEAYGAEMSRDVVRLLDHLEIGQAHVVGYSMGGLITLGLAVLAPDRVASAVLGGSGWSPPSEGLELQEALAESLEEGRGFGPLLDFLTPEGRPKMPPEQVEAWNEMLTRANDTKALAAVMRGLGQGVPDAEEVRAVEVPTLAVVGEIDPVREWTDTLKELNPRVEVVVIEGADHMTAFGRPEFLAAIRRFLAEHASHGEPGSREPTSATGSGN